MAQFLCSSFGHAGEADSSDLIIVVSLQINTN